MFNGKPNDAYLRSRVQNLVETNHTEAERACVGSVSKVAEGPVGMTLPPKQHVNLFVQHPDKAEGTRNVVNTKQGLPSLPPT